jgi:TldD protein
MDRASQLGATYADVRVEAVEQEGASAENGIIKTLAVTTGTSVGVRALAGGGWGFSSFNVPDVALLGDRLDEAVERAVRQAKATARFGEVRLAPVEPVVADLPLDIGREPWPLEEKQAEIVSITKDMSDLEGIALATGVLKHKLADHVFASTEGARIWERGVITEGSY